MATPKVIADLTTQLSTAISIGGTSFSISSGTDDDGAALPTGLYYFTLDNGSSNKEYLAGTLTGTDVTSVVSVSRQGVETSGAVRAHRVGASVILTDFNTYKKYMDEIALVSAPDANTTTKGVVEEATQAEVDAGTATGATTARLYQNPSTVRAKAYHDYAVDSVGTDAYAITITPAITAYAAGQEFTFKAGTANTGACTLNVSGLGAKSIKKNVSNDLDTGDILANQVIKVVYDGTNMQLQTVTGVQNPTVKSFINKTFGDSTTQFDITNTAGTTYRYTYDATGTDPVINASSVPIGAVLLLTAQNFSAGNNGTFTVTGTGSNYFEVTNASGVVESNKTLGTGAIVGGGTWTKPTGLKYVEVEVQAGGGNGFGDGSGGGGGGGGGGGKKTILASALGSTETVTVGAIAGNSSFGSHLTTTGGVTATGTNGEAGGTSSGGDFNMSGSAGGRGAAPATVTIGGAGGSSMLGRGGTAVTNTSASTATNGNPGVGYGAGGGGGAGATDGSPAATGGTGTAGIVIVKEYYI